MTVAFGTAASAAAFTLSAVVPVSRVSFGPWLIVAGSWPWFGAAAGYPLDELLDEPLEPDEPLVAAPAMPAAPTAMPAAAAAVSSHARARWVVGFIRAPSLASGDVPRAGPAHPRRRAWARPGSAVNRLW